MVRTSCEIRDVRHGTARRCGRTFEVARSRPRQELCVAPAAISSGGRSHEVLVPYDGSDLSEQAAVMAIELLAQHHLDLQLLRVTSDPEGATEAQESLTEATERLARSPAAVTQRLTSAVPNPTSFGAPTSLVLT